MPTPSFSKDITSVFNASELADDLKYDVTCRLIGEALEMSTVSLHIYDAVLDELVCRGNYLSPQKRSKFNVGSNIQLAEIIENIGLFEFFEVASNNSVEITLENYKASPVCPQKKKNLLTAESFDTYHSKWLKGYEDIYKGYKKRLHEESHKIDNGTITSRYFTKLLSLGKQLTSEIEIRPMKEGPQNGRVFFEIWRNIGVVFDEDSLFYIGLPLFATERYTGIIRLTTYRNPKSKVDEILESNRANISELNISQHKERLNNFAQIVSLHLKTNYYLNGYRILSNIKIDEDNNLKIDNEELNTVCNILTTVIKCNGCILRLTNNEYEKSNPPIKGVSDTLKPYLLEYINSDNSEPFSQDISELLNTGKENGHSLKAINFSILDNIESGIFDTFEYYYDGYNKLKAKKIQKRQFKDFTSGYIEVLKKMKMCEVVVLKLEFVNYGFLILTNTDNRKFTASDIEMILLASERIGLEIKHHQDSETIRAKDRIIAYEEHARLIIHQIGAPVRAVFGHAHNLKDNIFTDKKERSKIEQLYKMTQTLVRQINSLQKYLDWETTGITPKKDQRYSLESYIRAMAFQFEGLTAGTGIKIWTIKENWDTFYDYCYLSRSMLDEIVNCLLDNAVKYSFSAADMKKYNIKLSSDPRSDGHIHIKLYSTPETISITVENYGCAINSSEYSKIFQRGIRGIEGIKKSPIGSGIGLYLVKKVADAFGGNIEVSHDTYSHKTTFKITLTP